jgi:hypothetical protein
MSDTKVFTRKDVGEELVRLKEALVSLSGKDVLSKERRIEVINILSKSCGLKLTTDFVDLSNKIDRAAQEVVYFKRMGLPIEKKNKGVGGEVTKLVVIIEKAKNLIADQIVNHEALLKALPR